MIQLRSRIVRIVIGAVIATAAVIPVAAPAGAAPNDQCVVNTNGTDSKGNLIITSMRCYNTLAQALRAAGASNVPDTLRATDQATRQVVQRSSSILAIHYDSSNGTGATLTVNGTTCNGGGLNVSATWNDRISSTMNGCPTVVHYETTNYAGSSFSTFGSGNFGPITGYMDNKTSSIKYF